MYGLAIALVADPQLLVLDEPTVALDVEGRQAFWTTMRAFAARGKTIVFATHYLEEADAYADRAVLMAHGAIVADGPDDGDQGDGRHAHDPRDAARGRARRAERAAGREQRRAPRRGGGDELLRTPTRRSARCSRPSPTRATSRSPAAGLEQAFLALTGDSERGAGRADAARVRALRAAAHAAQPPLLHASRSASR